MTSAVVRAHNPDRVQLMFFSDSEISPIFPAGSKGFSSPLRDARDAHRYKRSLDKTSPDARPARRAGGNEAGRSRSPKGPDPPSPLRRVEIPLDQTEKKAIEALTEQIRHDEAYMTQMATFIEGMAKTIVELEDKCMRWNKWNSDTATRVIQIEGRINEDANRGQAFTLEKCKTIDEQCKVLEKQLVENKVVERINRIEEMVAGHNHHMDHLYRVKPAEGYTIKTNFEAIAQQVLEIKNDMALKEQILTQMTASNVQVETNFLQIASTLENARKDTQKQFDEVRSEASVKLT